MQKGGLALTKVLVGLVQIPSYQAEAVLVLGCSVLAGLVLPSAVLCHGIVLMQEAAAQKKHHASA